MPQTAAVLLETVPDSPRVESPGRVLIDRETVLIKLAISDATLRRRIKRGVLPRPVELGSAYCLRWYLDEIEAAIANLARQQSSIAPQP